ncbi:MAG: DegV family protein [Clostridia bacterium]|nr:DegV family protein [Clostridia bacterium]
MSKFVIIPDSSCDLTSDLRERFGIPDYLRGIIYFPDGREELADLDWKYFTPEEFYDSMKDGKLLYRTAFAPMGQIIEVFEKYLSQGIDIISVSLSSALSGSYQQCTLVAKQLLGKYPERKIICIDSLRYSTSLSLLIIMASELRNSGATIEETAAWIEENKHCIHQCGPMDNLFFLVKTGRISNFKAFFGTLVGVNPMADFNRQGLSEVLAKFKGKRAAFDATLRYMEKTIIDPEKQRIFVAHSNRKDSALTLVERIKENFAPREVILNDIGMSCGASIGPGLCAAFYHGKPISEGLVEEKGIMAEIATNMKAK